MWRGSGPRPPCELRCDSLELSPGFLLPNQQPRRADLTGGILRTLAQSVGRGGDFTESYQTPTLDFL